MCGAGKSVVADDLVIRGFGYVRFGQATMDYIKEHNMEVNEKNEKYVRELLRKEHGMDAFAKLNIPNFDRELATRPTVGDGLYSWSEYKTLKEHYGDKMVVLGVYTPPKIRYERLSKRTTDENDAALRNRLLTPEQAKSRDYAEIENIEKGGPIAMADYMIDNTGNVEQTLSRLEYILNEMGLDK